MPVALAVDTRTQHAFVRNGDGTVSVLDLTRGTTLRTVVVSKRDADAKGLAVDEQTGRVFVTSGRAVSVLDAASDLRGFDQVLQDWHGQIQRVLNWTFT